MGPVCAVENLGGLLLDFASGSSDETIKFWNIAAKRCVATLQLDSSVYALANLGGGILASGSERQSFLIDGQVHLHAVLLLWDIASTRCIAELEGHQGSVHVLAKLEGSFLASGSSDRTVKLWNIVTKECVRTLAHSCSFEPGGPVYALSNLDGGLLASLAFGAIKVWNVLTGECVVTVNE